jgi:arylsulfatase A-like enzyme
MANKHHNLLFIFTDQQQIDTLACYGNNKIRMPALNALAGQAVVFTEPYCTQPVCTPSRGSLMTGLWPHAHGAPNNNIPIRPDASCLPELLPAETRAAYRTAYIGKWHLGDEIFAQHGFDQWVSTEDGYYPYYGPGRDRSRRSSYHHFLLDNGFVPARPDDGIVGFSRDFAARLAERYGKPHFQASRAAEFIRANEGRPWMLAVNFLEPHPPRQSPRDEQYHPDEVDLPDNFGDLPKDNQLSFLPRENAVRDESWLRRIKARYWGLNSLVDTQAGRILQALADTGQRENTIVVFTSDHGEMMGSHGLMNKCVMFKEATRVPLLVRLPGQEKQGHVTGPVSQIDLVPTLLDLMGCPAAAAGLPGRSLAGLCRGAAAGRNVDSSGAASPCVIEWNPGKQKCREVVRTIVTPAERYSRYSSGEQEYYDLKNDPREADNLAGDAGRQVRVRELRAQLAEWQQAAGDTAVLAGVK